MKVKIGNTTYDSNKQPIMIVLADQDKKNIANMLPECTKYCVHPGEWSEEQIKKFMEVTDEN